MNRGSTRKTGKDCNVCGSEVEIVGNAASQCSNNACPTRNRDSTLSTDSTNTEQAAYWEDKARSRVPKSEISQACMDAYRRYNNANDPIEMEQARGAVDALLELTAYNGWGDLDSEVQDG